MPTSALGRLLPMVGTTELVIAYRNDGQLRPAPALAGRVPRCRGVGNQTRSKEDIDRPRHRPHRRSGGTARMVCSRYGRSQIHGNQDTSLISCRRGRDKVRQACSSR